MKRRSESSLIVIVHLVLSTLVVITLAAESALSQGGRTTTTPDGRYGEGGNKATTKDALNRTIKEEWTDKNGAVIERAETTFRKEKEIEKEVQNPQGNTSEEREKAKQTVIVKTIKTTYYRVTRTGTKLRSVTTKAIDRAGRETSETIDYDDSGKVTGKTVRSAENVVTRFGVNATTGQFEKIVDKPNPPAAPQPPSTTPDPPAPSGPPSREGMTDDVMVYYKPFEFYAGFSHNRVDVGDGREGFNGFAMSFTGNVNRYVGLKGYYSFHTHSFEEDLDTRLKRRIHQALGGVQLKDNASNDNRFRPFAHFMAGLAHHGFSVDNAVGNFSDSATGFGATIGGGIDIRLNDRLDFRVLQIDYNPNHVNDVWQHNVRAGFGVVFKFGGSDDDGEVDDARDPSISGAGVPQDPNAKKCEWKRKNLGINTNVTQVRSDNPTVVEVRINNLSGSGGFEYHCKKDRGTAMITYKYTDVNGAAQEEKLRVFCNAP